MITHEIKRKPQPRKKFIFITLSLLVIDFIFFILIKCDVFNNPDNKIRTSLQASATKISLFPKIIHYFNHFFIYYSIIIIINNFSNIYKVFMLFHILSISVYVSALIKFIFYKASFNVLSNYGGGLIYYCDYGWTLPSTEIVTSVSFYLSLWKLFFDSSNEDKNNDESIIKKAIFKYFFLVIVIAINIVNMFGIAKIGYYFMSQIIFSIILGVIIYLFVFETNIIWLNDGQVLINFIREKFNLYIIINFLLTIISFIPFIIEINMSQNENDKKFSQCRSINGSSLFDKSGNYKSFIDGTCVLLSMYIGHIFLMIGYKFEVGYIFEGDSNVYYQFHFPISVDDMKIETDNMDNTGSIVLARDTEWNNTSGFICFLRLIATFGLSAICFIPYFVIGINSNEFGLLFLVKYLLCFALFSSGISLLFKVILRFMKLTNETLYSILSDK